MATQDESDLAEKLGRLVRSDAWMMDVLQVVRALQLPDCYVGGGLLRDLVWDGLHGGFQPGDVHDIDVAFFDRRDLSREREREAQRLLCGRRPSLPWEVVNQAGVHLWYLEVFGREVEPLQSTRDAVAAWPEPATAVAVRLSARDAVEVVAPLGLHDLMTGVCRRNPTRVDLAQFRLRVERKRVHSRWPRVTVIDG